MVYFQRNCKYDRFESSLVCKVLQRNKRNDNNDDSKNGGKNCKKRINYSKSSSVNLLVFLQTNQTIGFADKQYLQKKSSDHFDSQLRERQITFSYNLVWSDMPLHNQIYPKLLKKINLKWFFIAQTYLFYKTVALCDQ